MSQPDPVKDSPRWLKLAFAVTVGVLVLDAVYLLGVKFEGWIHADSSTPVLAAAKMLKMRVPLPFLPDWYYPNGDVWALAPHLFAWPTVPIWGVGPESLRASVVLGFAVELALLFWVYRGMSRSTWASAVAAAATLIAWSKLHVIFMYCELSYGLVATLYAINYWLHVSVFLSLAGVEAAAPTRRALHMRWAGATLLMFASALQSPPRAVVFVLAPLLLVFAWPWRGVSLRARARVAGVAVAAWILGTVIYRGVFPRVLQFSNPSGHSNFRVRDLAGIRENLRGLGEGFLGLAGDFAGTSIVVVPALALIVGSAVIVVRHLFAERTPTAERAYAIAVLGQLGAVLGPMVLGNLIVNAGSARYLMVGLVMLFGLAVLVATKELGAGTQWQRRTAKAWLVLLPVTAASSVTTMVGEYSLESMSDSGQWVHKRAHAELADQLVQRGLKHGFSTYWNANLVSFLSRGRTLTCPVNFASGMIPYKWNTDATCFDPSRVPDRVYVVSTPEQRDEAARATRETLGEPSERFSVSDAFDVAIFDISGVSRSWFDAPLPEGDRVTFPLSIAVRHPQMGRGKDSTEAQGSRVVGIGKDGVVAYGPYLRLPRGDYRLRWFGSGVDSPGQVVFDIAAEGGKEILAKRSLHAKEMIAAPGAEERELIALEFSLHRPMDGVEARVFTAGDAKVILDRFVLERR